MPIQAISAQRLYQQVADQISALIQSGEFAGGGRLPPERDLARQFSVSRPTVREALIALEIAGLVEVRIGSGAYVCQPRAAEAARTGETARAKPGDAGASAFELITARRLVEPAVAGLAAQQATKEDLARIKAALDQFERDWNGTHWEKLEADRQFHMALAEATHNGAVIAIVDGLWRDMFGQIFAVLSERTRLQSKQSMTMHDHRTIFHCIERGDAMGAQAAMMNHLVHVEFTLLEVDAADAAPERASGNGRSAPR